MHFPSTLSDGSPCRSRSLATALAGMPGPAAAADPPATTLTLSAPASGKAGLPAPFTATLTDDASAPIAGATVTLHRTGGATGHRGLGHDDQQRHRRDQRRAPAGTTTWQATYAGDATHAPSTSQVVTVVGRRYASTVQLTGPSATRRRALRHPLRALEGRGRLAGQRHRHHPAQARVRSLGRRTGRVRTSSTGRVSVLVAPRVDSQWRAIGAAGSWWLADTSAILAIDNVPQISPAAYPKGAPDRTPHPPRPAPPAPDPRRRSPRSPTPSGVR